MTVKSNRLGEISSIITKGTTPTSVGFDFAEIGIPFLRVQNLVDGKVDLTKTPLFISEATHRALSRSTIYPGDILISIAGTIGRVAIVSDDALEMNSNQAIGIVRLKDGVNRRYLLHWLQSNEAQKQIRGAQVTATISNLSLSELRNLSVPLPPLAEQKRIAAILDKADAIRRNRQQALRLTDEFLRSVFLDMFGDPERMGWEYATVEEMASDTKGSIRTGPFGSQLLHSEFVDEGIAVLGIDNAVRNTFAWGQPRFISEEKYRELHRYTVHPGDVIITIMGTCGRCAIVPDDIPRAINTKHLCCITLDPKKCLPEFLHSYFLLHPTAKAYLGKTAKGAIMDGLNMGLIKSLPVPMVPITKQRDYTKIAKRRMKLAEGVKSQVAKSEHLFSSLQQRAFRGEL